MNENNYPRCAEHVLEHLHFSQTIHDFNVSLTNSNANILLEVLTFLKKWLRHHILKIDADYARFNSNAGKIKSST
jgi:hemerythrin-like metal-binding protein